VRAPPTSPSGGTASSRRLASASLGASRLLAIPLSTTLISPSETALPNSVAADDSPALAQSPREPDCNRLGVPGTAVLRENLPRVATTQPQVNHLQDLKRRLLNGLDLFVDEASCGHEHKISATVSRKSRAGPPHAWLTSASTEACSRTKEPRLGTHMDRHRAPSYDRDRRDDRVAPTPGLDKIALNHPQPPTPPRLRDPTPPCGRSGHSLPPRCDSAPSPQPAQDLRWQSPRRPQYGMVRPSTQRSCIAWC